MATSGLPAQQVLTPEETASIQKDISRHFGDAPDDPGPKAALSAAMKPRAIDAAIRKVADWQLARAQAYFDRIWTWSVLYTGFMAASTTLHEPRYRDAMEAMGEKFDWELRSEHPNADDQSIGQTYLELYLQERKPAMKAPTQAALDGLLNGPGVAIPKNQAQIPWWWCDALFMAPPVWTRMYAATSDAKYLKYVERALVGDLQAALRSGAPLILPRHHLPAFDGWPWQSNLLVAGEWMGNGGHRTHPRVHAGKGSRPGEVRDSIAGDGGGGRCPARSKDGPMACEPAQR